MNNYFIDKLSIELEFEILKYSIFDLFIRASTIIEYILKIDYEDAELYLKRFDDYSVESVEYSLRNFYDKTVSALEIDHPEEPQFNIWKLKNAKRIKKLIRNCKKRNRI